MPTVVRRRLLTLGGDTILTLGGDNLVTLDGGMVNIDDAAGADLGISAGRLGVGTSGPGVDLGISAGPGVIQYLPMVPPTGLKAVRSADYLTVDLDCDTHPVAGVRYKWYQGDAYRPASGWSEVGETATPTHQVTGLTPGDNLIFAVSAYLTVGTLEGLRSLAAYAQAQYEYEDS